MLACAPFTQANLWPSGQIRLHDVALRPDAFYALGLPLADRLYMTLVHADIAGDTVFPTFNEDAFSERRRLLVPADVDNAHDFSLVMLERRAADLQDRG